MSELFMWTTYFAFGVLAVTIASVIFLSWKAFHFLIAEAGTIYHQSPCNGTWGICVCTESYQQWRTRRQWFGNVVYISVFVWDGAIIFFGGFIPYTYWLVITYTLVFGYLIFAVWSASRQKRLLADAR